jgi:hypothetical protein
MDLDSLLILLKNTPTLSDVKMLEIYEKSGLKPIDLIENSDDPKCQESILYITKHSTINQSELFQCNLQTILKNKDEDFCLNLMDNLLNHFDLNEDF